MYVTKAQELLALEQRFISSGLSMEENARRQHLGRELVERIGTCHTDAAWLCYVESETHPW